MIWAGSIHRRFGLYPCWRSKLSSIPRQRSKPWRSRARMRKFRKYDTDSYWANHKVYNLEDRRRGLKPEWFHMWRRS